MSNAIDKQEGRALFGADPANYDAIRPPYPEQIYEFLMATGALHANATTLEIGAGNGLATRRLLELGVGPLTAIEPDARFAPLLTALATAQGTEIRCIHTSLEEAALPANHFDLVVAATAFHWIEPIAGLTKIAKVLKPGGYVALWWNVFGDPERSDPFHDATQHIFKSLARSPSDPANQVPFALNTAARFRDFATAGQFKTPEQMAHRWTLFLNTEQVGALYATFSSISRLPAAERESILQQLMNVAETQFGGRVEKNMVSPVYVAQRSTVGN